MDRIMDASLAHGDVAGGIHGLAMAALAASAGLTSVTAAEIFTGEASGDGMWLYSEAAERDGLHPLSEIHDVLLAHDNGLVALDMGRATRTVAPLTPILVSGPVRRSPPLRCLPAPTTVPVDKSAAARDVRPATPMAGTRRGELAVVDNRGTGGQAPWLVCWRCDGRQLHGMIVLGGHSTERFASVALRRHLATFDPPAARARARTRPPDGQRSRVYLWQERFQPVAPLDGIQAIRAYAAAIYGDLGLEPPEISLSGRLKEHSLFSIARGMVLAASWGGDSGVVLHEMAHDLVGRFRTGRRQAAHGPAFMAMHVVLLERFAGVDREAMLARAAELELAVGPPPVLSALPETRRAPYVGPGEGERVSPTISPAHAR